jgi:hypothetical protein
VGECANDFRTLLLSQPEFPCLELIRVKSETDGDVSSRS